MREKYKKTIYTDDYEKGSFKDDYVLWLEDQANDANIGVKHEAIQHSLKLEKDNPDKTAYWHLCELRKFLIEGVKLPIE